MSATFFLVGGLIFATYIYFTTWNIYNPQGKSKSENYSNLGGEGCDLPSEEINPDPAKQELEKDKSNYKKD